MEREYDVLFRADLPREALELGDREMAGLVIDAIRSARHDRLLLTAGRTAVATELGEVRLSVMAHAAGTLPPCASDRGQPVGFVEVTVTANNKIEAIDYAVDDVSTEDGWRVALGNYDIDACRVQAPDRAAATTAPAGRLTAMAM